MYILIGSIVVINIFSLLVMWIDKKRSMKSGNVNRIPEGVLFFLASIFGSVGIYLGMILFRHKTRKWYFQLGVPFLILQGGFVIYFIKIFST